MSPHGEQPSGDFYYMFNKKEYNKKWKKENPEKTREYNKKWRKKNLEYYKKYQKKWRQKNPEGRISEEKKKEYLIKYRQKHSERQRKRRKNPKHRINDNMSSLIWSGLKNNKMNKHWETLVDYSLQNLIEHLESQFDENMNWENYGSYWWVDHRRPRSLFNFTKPKDPEFQECWALRNLQPMEKIENMKKGNRY